MIEDKNVSTVENDDRCELCNNFHIQSEIYGHDWTGITKTGELPRNCYDSHLQCKRGKYLNDGPVSLKYTDEDGRTRRGVNMFGPKSREVIEKRGIIVYRHEDCLRRKLRMQQEAEKAHKTEK